MNYNITLSNITKKYGSKLVLNNISLSLNNNWIYVLMGKNGCGKSTLLNIVSKYDTDYLGNYETNGLSIGYLLQDDMLFRNLTVRENLLLQSRVFNKKNVEKVIKEISEKLSLQNFLDKKISELSGGERKKVSIGQIMIKKSDIIILDEPTANIQKEYAKELLHIIFNEFKNKILIIASHDKVFDQNNKVIKIELKDGEVYYGI